MRLARYGLGLSIRALPLPLNVETAIAAYKLGEAVLEIDQDIFAEEMKRRVADEPFIVDGEQELPKRPWLVGAVDGSTRGGVLSFLGEDDLSFSGHAPLVSINTAVGQINRQQKIGNVYKPTFLRLPERPEDMQREDNRFTVMAKMLFPDMSDGTYMHAVWNAMDLVEARAALRLLGAWTTPQTHLEVPAADVVLKDGAVSPQDRDFIHYSQYDTYGKIVREAIRVNWEIAKHCKDDGQTVAGVVKNAQMSVLAPVVNWFASQTSAKAKGSLAAWPMNTMNLLPDQVLMTQLLTAGRQKDDPWVRTCLIVRPFHALTNFSSSYSGGELPSQLVMKRYEAALRDVDSLDPERAYFWRDLFRPDHDPYVQMLDHVSYASFFLGAVPRLDIGKQLPRFEFIVNASNHEADDTDWSQVATHRDRLISATKQLGFDVAAEHNMFDNKAKLDVLPSLLIQVHDTVKIWAADLLSRVQEYVGYYIARHVKTKRLREPTIRPFSRTELELLHESIMRERDDRAGATTADTHADESPRLTG